MEGTDYATESEEGGWYVPVIVSNAREDVDKGVHICAYNTHIQCLFFSIYSWEAFASV